MIPMLFGKLPAHGDFVSRGIAAAERDALDAWLAASIADARALLGDGFDQAYDLAPPSRFAWADMGPDGQGGWSAGAMAPSIDGVGRRYPVLVAFRGIAADRVAPAAALAEALIYDALAAGWTADRLVRAVADASPDSGPEWTSAPGWWTVDAAGAVAARIDGPRPPGLVRTVLTMPLGEGEKGA